MSSGLFINNIYFELTLILLIYLLINYTLKKNLFLIDNIQSSTHKREIYSTIGTPLSGGLLFVFFFSFYYFKYNDVLIFFLFIVYFLGLLSDLNLLKSPKIRFLFQISILVFYVFFTNTEIISISIPFFDNLLKNNLFNIFFVTFCILVLINGYNFIDGVNTLVVGNFILCLTSIILLSKFNNLNVDLNLLYKIMLICCVIFIFNIFGKSFLGDSGTYSISFVISVILINFAYDNIGKVSPYYIANLLWYPAIENLFTIIRRILNKRDFSKPDNKHLHQLIYFYLDKKINLKNKLYINSLTGILINIYLMVSLIVAFNIYSHTISLVYLIIFNLIIYFSIYFYLSKRI